MEIEDGFLRNDKDCWIKWERYFYLVALSLILPHLFKPRFFICVDRRSRLFWSNTLTDNAQDCAPKVAANILEMPD